MRGIRSAGLFAAAAAAMLGAGVGQVVHLPNAGDGPGITQAVQKQIRKNTQGGSDQANRGLRALLGGGLGSWGGRQRRAGYGWTDRHARRVARKVRNQARHRASLKRKAA